MNQERLFTDSTSLGDVNTGPREESEKGPKNGTKNMQANELPTTFVRRCFAEVMAPLELSTSTFERKIGTFFHADYQQCVDDQTFDRDSFASLTKVQKTRLATPPVFNFKKLVATEPQDGLIHVTSVHSVSARLKNGDSMLQKVVALIDIDVATGTIIGCDENTRMETSSSVIAPSQAALAVAQLIRTAGAAAAANSSSGSSGSSVIELLIERWRRWWWWWRWRCRITTSSHFAGCSTWVWVSRN